MREEKTHSTTARNTSRETKIANDQHVFYLKSILKYITITFTRKKEYAVNDNVYFTFLTHAQRNLFVDGSQMCYMQKTTSIDALYFKLEPNSAI